MHDRLAKPVTLDKGIPDNTSLRDAIELISNRYDITILVGTQAFEMEGTAAVEDVAIAHAEDPPSRNGRSAITAAESLDPPGEGWALFRPFLEEAAFLGDGVPVGALPLRPIEGRC
jgi:hypothetical protein